VEALEQETAIPPWAEWAPEQRARKRDIVETDD
jgi:hypothetical protein